MIFMKFLLMMVSLVVFVGCGSNENDSKSNVKIMSGNQFKAEDQMYKSHAALLLCGATPTSTGDMLDPSKCQPICSGTIVASHWILTAAHCFRQHDIKNIHIGLFSGSYLTAMPYQINEVKYPSDVDTKDLDHVHTKLPMSDIALVRLNRDIRLGNDYKAMPIANTFVVQGLKGWIMGNGWHNGNPNPLSQLLWKDAEIKSFDVYNDIFKLGDHLVNPGDSGSSFITWNSYLGRLEIQGVTSWIIPTWPWKNSGYTYLGGRHRLWIYNIISQ